MLVPRFSSILNSHYLNLRGWRLEAAGARLLADDPRLIKIRMLDLCGQKIGDEGLAALLSSRRLRPLTELRLAENGLSIAGVRALVASPAMSEVSELDLSGNGLGPDAITELAPLVPRLEILELSQNPLGDAGARALAAAGPRCKELSLRFTGLGPEGLAALVDAGVLAGTDSLQLTGNPLGDAGAEVLARLAPQTGGLSHVNLGWTDLSPRGLAVLLDSGLFDKGLDHLSLRGNPLGEAGLRLLAEHPRLPAATLFLDVDDEAVAEGVGDGPASLMRALRARTRVYAAPKLAKNRVLECPYCCEALDPGRTALCPHCRLDASRDSATDEDARRHRDAERRPCPHCDGAMYARARRCSHCASWAVTAQEIESFGAV
jgi:hypothetical protein